MAEDIKYAEKFKDIESIEDAENVEEFEDMEIAEVIFFQILYMCLPDPPPHNVIASFLMPVM